MYSGAGKMPQQLRALSPLAEYLNFVPRMQWHCRIFGNSSARASSKLSDLCAHQAYTQCTSVHAGRALICRIKISTSKNYKMCCGYMWKTVKIGVEKIKDLKRRRNIMNSYIKSLIVLVLLIIPKLTHRIHTTSIKRKQAIL